MTHSQRHARADAAGSPQLAAGETPQVQDLPVLSHAKRRAFIAAYSECGSVTRAASAAGVSRRVHYQWLADADYRRAFMEAREAAADLLEAEVRRRAVDGWDEPVYHRGKIVGTVKKKSDVLLMFLMKSLRPERYRDNAPLPQRPEPEEEIRRQLARLSEEQLRQLIERIQRGETDLARAPATRICSGVGRKLR